MRSTATFSLLLFVLLSIWNSQGLSKDARKFGHDGRESVFIFYGPGTPKTRITEQDMKQIVALSPKKLRFDHVVIDRKAKALFSDFSSLEELIMVRTNFDDDDLRSLARCQGLRFANLSDSDVTDDIIPVLAAFQELRTVYLSRTAVTWTAAQELEALRPDMTVHIILGRGEFQAEP